MHLTVLRGGGACVVMHSTGPSTLNSHVMLYHVQGDVEYASLIQRCLMLWYGNDDENESYDGAER